MMCVHLLNVPYLENTTAKCSDATNAVLVVSSAPLKVKGQQQLSLEHTC